MKKTYDTLRSTHQEFIYHNYTYYIEENVIKVSYDFEIVGLDHFHPTWEFPYSIEIEEAPLKVLLFSLGMVELISYWKLTCAPKVCVLCGNLTKEQIAWWKKLYYNGLGEFYYLNGVMDETIESFMQLCANDTMEAIVEPIVVSPTQSGYLVPIGGGKDSVVTLELLHGLNQAVTTYSVNRIQAVADVIALDEQKEGDILAKRMLDAKLIAYNRQGYLNGHTPFSAIVAFSSVISALLNGIEQIALSNESSANESTVKDSHVNHQYSKSIEFENDFRQYITWILHTKITYYSALRPLLEVQIAKLFARATKYHRIFRSCNAGSKAGIWCGECPKCLFVYMILLPFLTEEELCGIFGGNLLEKSSLEQSFRELVGIADNKPFECVGTREEVVSALVYYREHAKRMPELLIAQYETYLGEAEDDLEKLLGQWQEVHNVPVELEKELRRKLEL